MPYLRVMDAYPMEIRVRPPTVEPAYYTQVRVVVDTPDNDLPAVIVRLYGRLPDGNVGLLRTRRASSWSGAAQNGIIGETDPVAWLYTRLGGCGCGDPVRGLAIPALTDELADELLGAPTP